MHAADRDSPIPDAQEKIAAMRQRHAQVAASIDYYEGRLAEQTAQLGRLNRNRDFDDFDDGDIAEDAPEAPPLSEEDLQREEEEMRQLERKKRELEDRVHSMSRDISGLR
jgi:chromosome segregation ATPase